MLLRLLLLVFLLAAAEALAVEASPAAAQSLIELLSKGEVYSADHDPNGKAGKHVPIVGWDHGRTAIITVPHVMSWGGDAPHFIDQVWATDQHGKEIFHKVFSSLSSVPQASFTVPAGVTHITVWEHCNLHGLWKSAKRPVLHRVPTEHEL